MYPWARWDAVAGTTARNRLLAVVSAAILPCVVWECGPPAGAGFEMPPQQVTVLSVKPQTVAAHFRYQGVAEASKHVEIRSQLNGIILARPFTEGTDVAQGALLYQIDPVAYEATYRNAVGQLDDAKAREANAERNLERIQPLLAEHAVAVQDVDNAQHAADQAKGDIVAAQGAVDRAKKDLNDTEVRAPVAGRVGLANMVLGARVTGPTDLMTTLDQVDPIYVRFSPPEEDVLEWRREVAAKQLSLPEGRLRVRAYLADGTVDVQPGALTYADITIGSQTGTQTLRATFVNRNHVLLPGQFVQVELLDVQREGAILIPQRAVQQGLAGSYVFVVGDSNKVGIHPVQASAWQGSQWVVSGGLAAGDKVIVDGVQKIYPGTKVNPVAYNAATDTAAQPMSQDIPAAPAIPLTSRQ
jgi:membrane fusion protein (multidrug efflux system)